MLQNTQKMWADIPRLMIQHFTPYETNITQHYPWDKEKRQFGALVAVWALEFPEHWGDCRLALLCFRAQVLGGKCWWLRGMRGEAVSGDWADFLFQPQCLINSTLKQTFRKNCTCLLQRAIFKFGLICHFKKWPNRSTQSPLILETAEDKAPNYPNSQNAWLA